jgi:carboxymethylenebutenolidase
MSVVELKDLPAFVAGKGTFGIIVIQEWWGLTSHMKNITTELADKLKCVAICPDLYRGKVGADAQEASHLMNNLDWNGAITDFQSCVDYLKSCGAKKVGTVGFCMGGALSIAAACHVPINAAVCFYGIPPKTFADPKHVKVPMQFHFGDLDNSPGFSDVAACDGLINALSSQHNVVVYRHQDVDLYQQKPRGSQTLAEFHRYSDGDHAFMNRDAPAYPFNVIFNLQRRNYQTSRLARQLGSSENILNKCKIPPSIENRHLR